MTIYGIDYTGKMLEVIAARERHKFIVIKENSVVVEEKAINVGKNVAELIVQIGAKFGHDDVRFQMAAAEATEKSIKKHIFEDKELGKVVVLSNPGILFEKELGIDVLEMLRRIAKTTLIVMLWPGVVEKDKIYFLEKSSDVIISQSDINYTIL